MSLSTDVTVRFAEELYEIDEAAGTGEVCVLLEGNYTRDITVTLMLEDGTAQGKHIATVEPPNANTFRT